MALETSEVRVTLTHSELWEKFHRHTTEMVLSFLGRNIYPFLAYNIEGLEEDALYGLSLEIERVDDNRYEFVNGEWKTVGRSYLPVPFKSVSHCNGIQTGREWMSLPITFKGMKLTNNLNTEQPDHIYLEPNHHYIPVLTVLRVADGGGAMSIPPVSPVLPRVVAKVKLECTEFITVTAYQNNEITRIKIDYNPFAANFRQLYALPRM